MERVLADAFSDAGRIFCNQVNLFGSCRDAMLLKRLSNELFPKIKTAHVRTS